jgi:hypothetical protein
MHLRTFQYHADRGFSAPVCSELDSDRTLVLVFGAPEFDSDPAPFAALESGFPRSLIVGCSTAGEIAGTHLADHSLSVAVVQFEGTEVRLATAGVLRMEDSYGAALAIARDLARPDLRAVLVLSDGLHVNGSDLARAFADGLPPGVAVTGGLAGDGSRFARTWVLHHGKATERIVAAVGFYGDRVQVGHGSQGGWDIFGPERVVTRSSSNVLFELDGKPALSLYKRYLGDRAEGLPAAALLFPLALRLSSSDTQCVVRTILGVDESQQSMTFAGEIPQGALVRLMRANLDNLIQGASHAAARGARLAPDGIDSPSLAIAISCVGRRLVLGERTEEEIEATLDALPAGTQQVGFYSYGELCPQNDSSCCDLHNQTMTLTTIAERR